MNQDFTNKSYDVVIVGSGAGGGTLAYALAKRGLQILLLERGEFIPKEDDNTSDSAAFGMRYNRALVENAASLADPYHPFNCHFYVGGQTKLFGGSLYRLRPEDFKEVSHPDGGISPAWPITYEELEPYYGMAEALYKVHGSPEGDPSEGPRSAPYPYGPVQHEPFIQKYVSAFEKHGFKVSHIPKAIDLGPSRPCTLCATCDAYPCKVHAKMDTEVACIIPALETKKVDLVTGAICHRLITDKSGTKIVEAEIIQNKQTVKIRGGIFVLSAGTQATPEILFQSKTSEHPNGLSNSSGVVGRYLHGHNGEFLMPFTGLKKVPKLHQKTFAINQFYSGSETYPYPLGVIQAVGQIPIWLLKHPMLRPAVHYLAKRSLLSCLLTEVLPDPENRVYMSEQGTMKYQYKPNNLRSYDELKKIAKLAFKKAGCPFVITGKADGPMHKAGTVRFGSDPKTSAIDTYCRSHDVENLYVVDMCFLPSSGSVNNCLTVIAQALRVAEKITS